MKKSNFRERLGQSILVASSLSFTLFLFTPAFVYFYNKSEFLSNFFNLVPLQLAISLLVIIILTALLTLLKRNPHQRGIAITIALSFLFWLEGSIIQWNMAVLTGTSIQFKRNFLTVVIDIALWIVILLVTWLAYKTVCKMSKYVAAIIILVQVVALIPHLTRSDHLAGTNSIQMDETEKYTFSTKRNIIVLVLDAFPADLFQEFLNEEPELKETFNDFTFFRNCLGGFPSTIPSVPLILSGEFYDNSETFKEFHRRIYLKNSLPKILKNNGYRVHLHTRSNTIHLSNLVASNFVQKKQQFKTILKDAATLFDVSLFKHVPGLFKKYIYNNHNWLFSAMLESSQRPSRTRKKVRAQARVKKGEKFVRCRDLDFFWSLTHTLKVDNKVPTFKYYHIKGLHPPIRLGKNCSFHKELPFDRAHLKEAGRCLLKHVREALDYLRARGIYHNSMIFIMGDHGTGHFGATHINHSARDPSLKPQQTNEHMQKVISGAIPLMLAKPLPGKEKSALTISDAPVSLGDISKTVLESLAIDAEVPGESIFRVKTTDLRTRRYMYYPGFKQWRGSYKGFIEEYLVRGFSWSVSSWKKSGRIFPPKEK